MKAMTLSIAAVLIFSFSTLAQESFKAENLTKGHEWQIIEQAFYDQGLQIGKFIPEENRLLSNWVNWNTVTIQNRGIIEAKLNGNDVEISMIERSYKLDDKWESAIGDLSKKNKKKYLSSLVEKISEINSSEERIASAVQNSILFPAFKPVTIVRGVAWRVDSVVQKTDAPNKDLLMCFTLTNTTKAPISIEAALWNTDQNFFGVPCKLENYRADGAYGGQLFTTTLNAGEKTSATFYFRANKNIDNISQYKLSHRIVGDTKRAELIIHNIVVPFELTERPTL